MTSLSELTRSLGSCVFWFGSPWLAMGVFTALFVTGPANFLFSITAADKEGDGVDFGDIKRAVDVDSDGVETSEWLTLTNHIVVLLLSIAIIYACLRQWKEKNLEMEMAQLHMERRRLLDEVDRLQDDADQRIALMQRNLLLQQKSTKTQKQLQDKHVAYMEIVNRLNYLKENQPEQQRALIKQLEAEREKIKHLNKAPSKEVMRLQYKNAQLERELQKLRSGNQKLGKRWDQLKAEKQYLSIELQELRRKHDGYFREGAQVIYLKKTGVGFNGKGVVAEIATIVGCHQSVAGAFHLSNGRTVSLDSIRHWSSPEDISMDDL